MTNVWIKKLRPLEILVFWSKSLFSSVTIYYDEYLATSAAVKALAFFQGYGLCRNFHPARLDYDTRDEGGHSLMYRANEHLRLCCERFLAQHAPSADERYRQMVKTYMRFHLEGQITFMVYAETRIQGIENQNNVFVVETNPLNTTLTDFYAARGLSVKSVFNFPKVLREAWIVPLALSAICLESKARGGLVRNNIDHIRPAIWVEYHGNRFSMDESWRQHLKAEDFDQVHYFDRSDSPVTEERISVLEKQGLKWIDLQRPSLLKLGGVSAGMLVGMLVELFSARSYPLWFKALRFQERLWYQSYLAVFRAFQVKLLIQHQDRGWIQAVQAHAIEDAGGIMVGFYYSNLPHCMDTFFLSSQHVIFVWGMGQYRGIHEKGDTARHILPSGIWFKPAYDARPSPKLDDLDENLEFVMSVFDSAVGHNCQMPIFQRPEALSSFLQCVLDLLENHPRWGAMLKFRTSKLQEYESILPGGGEIVRRINRLKAQKRVVELDFRASPVAAAENSDLAVCFVLNSAGIISGIFGHKAIHWDCSSLNDPVYDDPDQKILFKTLPDLSQAIESAAGGDKTIGDFSKWVAYQNYFTDFRGDQRIAMFIQAYMDEIVASGDPEYALALAVKRYLDDNHLPNNPFTLDNPTALGLHSGGG